MEADPINNKENSSSSRQEAILNPTSVCISFEAHGDNNKIESNTLCQALAKCSLWFFFGERQKVVMDENSAPRRKSRNGIIGMAFLIGGNETSLYELHQLLDLLEVCKNPELNFQHIIAIEDLENVVEFWKCESYRPTFCAYLMEKTNRDLKRKIQKSLYITTTRNNKKKETTKQS